MPPAEQGDPMRQLEATERYLRILEDTYAKYCVPRIDFADWTLATLDWRGDETILNIGSGAGSHYACLMKAQPNVRYFAVDPSPQPRHKSACDAEKLAAGDALTLPYATDSFDVVMANHVLYQMPDIDRCLTEIKRVLKPDGRVLAGAESLHTTPELQVLIRRAVVLLSENGANVQPLSLPCDAFALENGTRILARHFYAVVRHDLPLQLVFEAVEPALEYLEGMRDLRQHDLPNDVSWDDMMLIMQQQLSQLLQALGTLEISIACGALVASDRGGFINEFVCRDQASHPK